MLAARLGWILPMPMNFIPPRTKQRCIRGIPLTDADRTPWLAAIHERIAQWLAEKRNVVLACSALKQSYRQLLWTGPEVRFVYLRGTYDLIAERLRARKGHFRRRTYSSRSVRRSRGANRRRRCRH